MTRTRIRPRWRYLHRVLLLCIVAVCCSGPGFGQERGAPDEAQSITAEQIADAQKKALEANPDLDEAVRTRIQDLYAKSVQALKDEATFQSDLAKLQRSVGTAPEDLRVAREELAAAPPEIGRPNPDDGLAAVQRELNSLEEKLRLAEESKTEIANKLASRTRRRADLPGMLDEARKELTTVEAELGAPPPAQEAPVQTQAKRTLLLARQRALKAKISLLEREAAAFDTTDPVLKAQDDVATRRVTHARRAVSAWQEYANQRRRTEAENNQREAMQIAGSVAKPAKPLANELVKLAASLVVTRNELSTKIASTLTDIQRVESDTERLRSEFEGITARAEAAGFTNAVGVLLRKQRSALPSEESLNEEIRKRQRTISEAHIDRIEFQNQRSAVTEVDTLVSQLVETYGRGLNESEKATLAGDFQRVLQAQARYLDGVIQDLSSYLERLATLDTRQRTLLTQTREQSVYIAEHILWVRSATALSWATINDAGTTAAWLADQTRTVGNCLRRDALATRLVWLLAGLSFVILIAAQKRFRQQLHLTAEVAARRNTTQVLPTLRALGLTALIASPWSLLLAFVSWRLIAIPDAPRICLAAGIAARGSAMLLFTLDVFRHCCRSDGLGVAHFNWPPQMVKAARQPLRLLLIAVVPLAFLVLLLEQTRIDLHRVSLGRLALMTALLLTAYASHRMLRPASFSEFQVRSAWIRKSRYGFYALAVCIPLILCVLAATGYQYSARQLAWRLVGTAWVLLLVGLLASLFRRWQLLTYRALAMHQARKRRAELQQVDEKTPDEVVAGDFEDQAEALSASNRQLEKLQSILFFGLTVVSLVVIWSDVLPAFGFLGKVRLWESGIASEIIQGVETHEWITLQELLIAAAAFVITLFAARNLPGLLEFAVLQRLPVDDGFKYATSTVFRYVITTIGVILAFRVVGIGWSNVQWLVAAMTVGLGFGLQEIFANFVSGLILLFERPIRVGDTVTVSSITGTVTRIRIRATTIVDWDRKELIVPNREFVTGQLINWTLSDTVLRLIIKVGAAYGSDTRLATKLLYRVAEENPHVLSEPPPMVIFESFGESSLDFNLRCFVNSLQAYRTIAHELNMAIDDLFREHNIEIAFPQRDLHLRSIDSPIPVDTDLVRQATMQGP